MYIKVISAALLLFTSTQLNAQSFINTELNAGLNQVFGSAGFGHRFENNIHIRGMVSYGNFGMESKDGYPPYPGIVNDKIPFTEITGFSSSNVGVGTGIAAGYTFQLGDKQKICAEVLLQGYHVKDLVEIRLISSNVMNPGATWKEQERQQHSNWSAGLGVSHEIRLNHFLSVYYGIRANYFSVLLNSYEPTEGNVMCGVEPTLHAGLRFDLVKKEQ